MYKLSFKTDRQRHVGIFPYKNAKKKKFTTFSILSQQPEDPRYFLYEKKDMGVPKSLVFWPQKGSAADFYRPDWAENLKYLFFNAHQ